MLWGYGGMAYTTDLKSVARIGLEGSNPSIPTNHKERLN